MAGHWKRPCLLENGELACLSEMLKKTRPKSFARRLLHMNSRRHSADGAERRRVGGQPFLISDLAPSVGDGMERRGGREGSRGCWQMAAGGWLPWLVTWYGVRCRCCSYSCRSCPSVCASRRNCPSVRVRGFATAAAADRTKGVTQIGSVGT